MVYRAAVDRQSLVAAWSASMAVRGKVETGSGVGNIRMAVRLLAVKQLNMFWQEDWESTTAFTVTRNFLIYIILHQ